MHADLAELKSRLRVRASFQHMSNNRCRFFCIVGQEHDVISIEKGRQATRANSSLIPVAEIKTYVTFHQLLHHASNKKHKEQGKKRASLAQPFGYSY